MSTGKRASEGLIHFGFIVLSAVSALLLFKLGFSSVAGIFPGAARMAERSFHSLHIIQGICAFLFALVGWYAFSDAYEQYAWVTTTKYECGLIFFKHREIIRFTENKTVDIVWAFVYGLRLVVAMVLGTWGALYIFKYVAKLLLNSPTASFGDVIFGAVLMGLGTAVGTIGYHVLRPIRLEHIAAKPDLYKSVLEQHESEKQQEAHINERDRVAEEKARHRHGYLRDSGQENQPKRPW